MTGGLSSPRETVNNYSNSNDSGNIFWLSKRAWPSEDSLHMSIEKRLPSHHRATSPPLPTQSHGFEPRALSQLLDAMSI